jgi:N-methylhydantoinase A
MLSGDTSLDEISAVLQPLITRGLHEIQAQGVPKNDIRIVQLLDVRYRGQSYELSIPFCDDIHSSFDAHHYKAYGYSRPDAPLEIVNVRVRASGIVPKPHLKPHRFSGRIRPVKDPGFRDVYLSSAPASLPVYQGEALSPGSQFTGPALITRQDTTILVENGDRCRIDEYHNLWIECQGTSQAYTP